MFYYIRKIAKVLRMVGHKSTAIFDHAYLRQKINCEWPPIFILGVPRSGTTLLSQIMINSFEFAYFPNIANRFYMAPISATKICIKFNSGYHSEYISNFGVEKGWMALSEGGNIWNRWYPYEKREGFNYTPAGYLSTFEKKTIYQLIARQTYLFQVPFMTKNVKMSVRLRSLHEIFPDALFIHIKRDPVNVALSILAIKRKLNMVWFSAMPKEIEQIKQLPDLDKVCYQVRFLEKNIEEDIQIFNPDQYLIVKYEKLCSFPSMELHKIELFLQQHGCKLKKRDFKIPLSFELSRPKIDRLITKNEVERIKQTIQGLYGSSIQARKTGIS